MGRNSGSGVNISNSSRRTQLSGTESMSRFVQSHISFIIILRIIRNHFKTKGEDREDRFIPSRTNSRTLGQYKPFPYHLQEGHTPDKTEEHWHNLLSVKSTHIFHHIFADVFSARTVRFTHMDRETFIMQSVEHNGGNKTS